MPFMYPEELAKLRADHPGLQYDGYGRVIGVTPLDSVQQAANAIYQLPGMQPDAWSFGPTRYDFQHSKDFVGPMPQQWWDPNGELAQQGLGALVSGQDLPDVGFYSQWNPDTNSWVRHGTPSDTYRQPGSGRTARPQNPYVRQQTPDFGGQMVPPEVRYQQGGGAGPSYAAGTFLRSADRAARDAVFFGNPANETFPNLANQ